jgi:hypothetical protein
VLKKSQVLPDSLSSCSHESALCVGGLVGRGGDGTLGGFWRLEGMGGAVPGIAFGAKSLDFGAKKKQRRTAWSDLFYGGTASPKC